MSLRTALIVDDSQPMRRNVVHAITRMGGWTCLEAQDGAEGLKTFLSHPVDLIVTDINMPLMDGLKLIAQVRQGPKPSTVPIIVITTESAEEDRQRALNIGANAYLPKPVQAKAVVDAVKALFP